MAVRLCTSFSSDGEYLASCGSDGTLKLWETATGNLKQEYTPSSHLSATCSCLTWGPVSSNAKKKKKKRRSDAAAEAVENLELIALGTSSGTLLLYSVTKGELHTQLVDGHSDAVNGVCWGAVGSDLFSCSSDQHITQWCLSTATVKQKWKADKGPVYSVAMCHTKKHLLSASRAIKLWDLEKLEVLKVFTGHATEVLQLLPVPCGPCNQASSAEDATDIENSYFMSIASGERTVSAWQFKRKSKDKSSIASFSLPDEPRQMLVTNPVEGQPYLWSVVTTGGMLVIFEHSLNGRMKKPLKPRVRVQVASRGGAGGTPCPLPILASRILDNVNQTVLLAHGNLLKPSFEKMPFESLEKETCLIRDLQQKSGIHSEASISRVKRPEIPNDVNVLAPGLLDPAAPSSTSASAGTSKRRRRKSQELAMEERVSAMSLDKTGEDRSGRHPPKADTLAALLTQGLQSNDKKMLNSVLQTTNETIIRNTVKQLPMPVIVPLVQELSRRLSGHARSGHTVIRWIRTVLTTHLSYLMTFPELVRSFSGMYQMIESRVETCSRLSRLQGKLELTLSQIACQNQEEEEEEAANQPLLVYHEESSDDDLGLQDVIPDNSESEDNWEDLSDGDSKHGAEGGGEEEDMSGDDDDEDD